MHDMCMWLKGFTAHALCLQKNICLQAQHGTQFTFSIIEHFFTSSLLTCTPIRPSTRPSTGLLQISSPDEIYHCDDTITVSFGSLADLHSPTDYHPIHLAEEDNPVQVKQMFFHRPSMTSPYDFAESIATPPPESDLDDEQVRTMQASPLYLQCCDRPRVFHSLRRENSVSSSSHFRESAEKPVGSESTGKPDALQTQGSRVKKHFPREKIFPWNINRF